MKELNKDVLVKMIKEQIDEMCGVGPSMMKMIMAITRVLWLDNRCIRLCTGNLR